MRRLGLLGEVTWTSRRTNPDAIVLDLASPDEVIEGVLDAVAPDVIVNAAAYTAVDKAEEEESIATAVSGDAVGAMGKWAATPWCAGDPCLDGLRIRRTVRIALCGRCGDFTRECLRAQQACRRDSPS